MLQPPHWRLQLQWKKSIRSQDDRSRNEERGMAFGMDFYTTRTKMFPHSCPWNSVPGRDYEPNIHNQTLKCKENKEKPDKSEALHKEQRIHLIKTAL